MLTRQNAVKLNLKSIAPLYFSSCFWHLTLRLKRTWKRKGENIISMMAQIKIQNYLMRRDFTWRRRFTSIIGLQKCPYFFIAVNKIEMHVWAFVSVWSYIENALTKKTYNKYKKTTSWTLVTFCTYATSGISATATERYMKIVKIQRYNIFLSGAVICKRNVLQLVTT